MGPANVDGADGLHHRDTGPFDRVRNHFAPIVIEVADGVGTLRGRGDRGKCSGTQGSIITVGRKAAKVSYTRRIDLEKFHNLFKGSKADIFQAKRSIFNIIVEFSSLKLSSELKGFDWGIF